MRLFAPLVGAGLFAAFGGPTVAALDAATFVVAAATLVAIRHRERRPAPSEHHLRAQVAAGARHIVRSPGLRRIVTTTAIVLLVVGFSETIIFSVIQHGLHRPPTFFGVLSSAQGVGAVAGGLVAGGMLRRHGDGRVIGLGMLLFAVGETSLLVPHVAVVLVGFAIAGAGVSWAVVGYFTAVQLRTPGRPSGARELGGGRPRGRAPDALDRARRRAHRRRRLPRADRGHVGRHGASAARIWRRPACSRPPTGSSAIEAR